MTYKIAICDDSQADRDYVASLVRRWASEGDRSAHIEAFSSAIRNLRNAFHDLLHECSLSFRCHRILYRLRKVRLGCHALALFWCELLSVRIVFHGKSHGNLRYDDILLISL